MEKETDVESNIYNKHNVFYDFDIAKYMKHLDSVVSLF